MDKKKNTVLLGIISVFVLVIINRALSIVYAVISSDIVYSDSLVSAVYYAREVLELVIFGFALACIVSGLREKAFVSWAVLSAVFLLDGVFCFVYDIAFGNISLIDSATMGNALFGISMELVCLSLPLLLAALFKRKDKIRHGFGAAVAAETVLRLIPQLIICIDFMTEYDDITATEYAQMAGDLLLVLIKWGVVASIFAVFGCLILGKGEIVSDKTQKV